MARLGDAKRESRQERLEHALVRAIVRDLEHAFEDAQTPLTGFGVKISGWDYLLTLRALVKDVPSIAFIGADTLAALFPKAVRECRAGRVRWRADKF